MFTKIMVPLDGSELAERALPVAERLARATGAGLRFICVTPGRFEEHAGIRVPQDVPQSLAEGCARTAEAAAASARDAGFEAEAHRAFGDPAEEIAILADELQADLVVVGSRGLGAVRRALLGSVSLAVVKRSRVPVLVVMPAAAVQAPAA
jgi:nucleotide-binding universal stress UspA family protein